jgi:colanic acid biosynthesis glycosyl transferase WcaI|tara:strand:+ start:693 stop:1979 length:1287 start_codon:yes stop_codon:yes gene_type:complete
MDGNDNTVNIIDSTKLKKVILLTQFCEPEPQHVGIVFAKKLASHGHKMEVVTGFPNYPGGKIYTGFKRTWRKATDSDGIKLVRLWLFLSHSKSKIGRVLNYGSFALTSFIYLLFNTRRNDVIYVYHPPITVGLVAIVIKLVTGCKVIIDIQDLWPESLAVTGFVRNDSVLKITNTLCNLVYDKSDHIIVLSDGFKKNLLNKGVEKSKVSVIFNWADDEKSYLAEVMTREVDRVDPKNFNILYAGNLGEAQGLKAVIDAASICKKNGLQDVRFIFLGDGVSKIDLEEYSELCQLDNVAFIPRVDSIEAREYMEAADVMLVHLIEDPLFKITIPSKIQAYLAAGRPILVAVDGEATEIVIAAQAGVAAKSGDPESIANAALRFTQFSASDLRDMGNAGRDFYVEKMALDKGIHATDEIIRGLYGVYTGTK